MITLAGSLNDAEHQAALDLRDLILRSWRDKLIASHGEIAIVSGVKLHGQRTRDLDLVVLARFETEIQIRPFLSFSNPDDEARLERPDSVIVQSFCAVIEVKDHPTGRVRFVGTRVEVSYHAASGEEIWHDATQQNEDQMHALRNYLRVHGIQPPFVVPLIWLRNVPNSALPRRPHNILGGDSTWELFINVINQAARPRYSKGTWRLNAHIGDGESLVAVSNLLTKSIIPTGLDRQRMERINQRIADELHLHEVIGQKLLILRGRGGTGKTVRLLQLAKHLYDEQSARILILTYNRALVADIRRLLTIMGIADGIAERSIQIQTVHSYFYSLLRGLGIIAVGEEEFLQHYEAFKSEVREMLDIGAVNDADLRQLKENSKGAFTWDYVFIDEAQDWPEDERAILMRIYSHRVFAVADGVDQLIRSQVPADWRGALPSDQVKVVPLQKCLRMKAGLTRFVSTLAGELGLSSREWIANEEIPGGKVIIIDGGNALASRSLYESLITANRRDGNEPIDMLFCIPPSMAGGSTPQTEHDLARSAVAEAFMRWGLRVWDGASYIVRDTYPTQTDQLRIVQYDSCRGLEGWIVVLLGLDEFYTYKLNQLRSASQDDPTVLMQVARWLMIPLSRAMDTLVIHVTERVSPVYQALKAASTVHAEFVEWHRLL